jgi:MGT family glycosyltransferase
MGHVNPTTDVVVEAIARGHRVSFAAPAGYGRAAAEAGARVVTYTSLLTATPTNATTPEQFALYLPFILLAESRNIVPQMIAAFGADRPDVLLFDRTAYVAGLALRELWETRAIQLFPSFAYNDDFSLAVVTDQRSVLDPDNEAYQLLQGQLDEYCTEAGIAAIGVRDFALALSDEGLVFLPREFQPAGSTFPPGYAFLGPCFRSRQLESERSRRAESADCFSVYASLGTAFTDRPEVYARMVESLGLVGRTSLLSLGGAPTARSVGGHPPIRENVAVRDVVDQLAVLSSAEVFVTHAGMGGVQEALAFGVPMVCLPYSTEQRTVARRVAELGLGVVFDDFDFTVDDLSSAIEHVRSDDAIRRNLARFREVVARCGGAAVALDMIEA